MGIFYVLLNLTDFYEFYKSVKFKHVIFHRSKFFTRKFSIFICTLKQHWILFNSSCATIDFGIVCEFEHIS